MKKDISELDLLIDWRKKQEKYFKNYTHYTKLIKREAENLLGEVRVYVFGSILKKDEVPQDIDVLIISSQLKTSQQKSEIRAKIRKKIGFFTPFEIHLISPQEYKDWYQFFIKEKKKI